jgi:hypothetical protein
VLAAASGNRHSLVEYALHLFSTRFEGSTNARIVHEKVAGCVSLLGQGLSHTARTHDIHRAATFASEAAAPDSDTQEFWAAWNQAQPPFSVRERLDGGYVFWRHHPPSTYE